MTAQSIRDTLAFLRIVKPDDPDIPKLEADLVLANAAEREARSRRRRIRMGLATATHVLLRDGWVEVVRLDLDAREVVVANGTHREEHVGVRRVLDVRRLV